MKLYLIVVIIFKELIEYIYLLLPCLQLIWEGGHKYKVDALKESYKYIYTFKNSSTTN